MIDKAVKNVITSLRDLKDVYAMGIATFALQLTDHGLKKTTLKNFINMAKLKLEENQMWWEKSLVVEDYCSSKSLTLNTELSAYGLLSLLKSQEQTSKCLPIVKWLLNQRNSNGGFEGTQDTIIGIEALAKFADQISTDERNIEILSWADENENRFNVNKDNALILQSEVVSFCFLNNR